MRARARTRVQGRLNEGSVRIIAAKGIWEHHWDLPDLGGNPTLGEFPQCSIADILAVEAEIHAALPPNSMLVGRDPEQQQCLHVPLEMLPVRPFAVYCSLCDAASAPLCCTLSHR